MTAHRNDNAPSKAGLPALLRRPRVVAPVGVGIVVATGFAVSRLRPPPAPPVRPPPIVEPLPTAGEPPPVGARPTVRSPPAGAGAVTPPVPGLRATGFDLEIDMAARSSIAGRWFEQAEADTRLLCRAATFCAALDVYETVLELADSIESCGETCAAREAQAATRVAYIKARLPLLANSAGCAVGAEPCACVGLLAGADCRP